MIEDMPLDEWIGKLVSVEVESGIAGKHTVKGRLYFNPVQSYWYVRTEDNRDVEITEPREIQLLPENDGQKKITEFDEKELEVIRSLFCAVPAWQLQQFTNFVVSVLGGEGTRNFINKVSPD